jgi:hypothetical protein
MNEEEIVTNSKIRTVIRALIAETKERLDYVRLQILINRYDYAEASYADGVMEPVCKAINKLQEKFHRYNEADIEVLNARVNALEFALGDDGCVW